MSRNIAVRPSSVRVYPARSTPIAEGNRTTAYLRSDLAFPREDTERSTEKKILGFGEFQEGWHFGEEGVPFEKEIITYAVSLNREAVRRGFQRTNAFPGTDGSIAVTAYFREQYLEFTVEPDGRITLYHEQAHEEVSCSEGLSLQEAKRAIREFSEKWLGFASSVENATTTGITADFPRRHSGRAATSKSRLYTGNVYSNQDLRFATTYANTTLAS